LADRFERQNVLFIGIDWERKGGPELLQAFARLRARCTSATLTIVGCYPRTRVPGVQVVGAVPAERISDYLARATVFCMPSWREPFGIVYLEAMRAGLPVIAWDLGAVPDLIRDGENGYRVKAGDIDGLARRLEDLITSPERCRKMGECGQAIVSSRFTWDAVQQRMWTTLRENLCQILPD